MSKTRRWPFFIPVLLGVAAVVALKQQRPPPEQAPPQELAKQVRVIAAPRLEVVPKAMGHGTVRPARVWDAVAQVKGKVLTKHPRLLKGGILEQGAVLFGIDPADYQLAVAQTEADLAATRAQLLELVAKEANTRAALEIEEQALALSEKELGRKRSVAGAGAVSASDLETQQRALLTQQQSVRSQRNTLNLIPSQQALLEAQLARQEARLAGARRDLEHTQVRLPFTGRVSAVNVEQEQYVREGEVLASLDDLAKAEVEVQVPIERFAALLRAGRPNGGADEGRIDLLTIEAGNLADGMGLGATVRLHEGGVTARWEARFARVSDTLDPKTRTVGAIVEVDGPYASVEPGVRPPLFKGLFVEVELRGRAIPDALVAPASAWHDGTLHVVGPDDRLQVRHAVATLVQPEFVVVGEGLAPGERVVVSDLSPAVDGMLLKPVPDDQTLARLKAAASNGAPAP